MMKRFAVIIMLLAMFISPAYSADDDSTPYMPYSEQTNTQPVKKPAPKKKTPAKNNCPPKKKAPVKKAAPKKTVKRAPSRPGSLQQAITLINQGRYKEAKPYLLNAINANRNDANVWYWYGVWHEKLGCYHEAQYFYTKALRINPSFEPLSRVAYYPEDPDKIPLWDPKRPARVYPIETGDKNFTRVPPFGRDSTNFPEAPNDPVIPKVPAYVPPEPGSTPLDGDAWNPAVYVPPSPNDPYAADGTEPVYVPPEGPLEAERRETVEIEIARRETTREEELSPGERDRIIRADLPLYTPPAPGQKVTPPPASAPKVTEQPKKSSGSSQQKKQPSVPRRVVRQQKGTQSTRTSQTRTQTVRQNTNRSTQTQRRNTATRTVSNDVRPVQRQPERPAQPQRQPSRQQETQQRQQTPREPVRQTEREPQVQQRQQRQQRQEYMPPVGQYAPDPGTISETPIPPVGQGNDY